MVSIITISIDRYNALYKRALQADALEKENAELRERLNGTMTIRSKTGGVTVGPKAIKSFIDSDKYINSIDGSELRNDTNKITLDATEVYQFIKESLDKAKEEKELELDGDKYAKHLTKCGSVTKEGSVEFERNAKSDNGMIAKPIKGLKLRSRKRYATGGLATKGETW